MGKPKIQEVESLKRITSKKHTHIHTKYHNQTSEINGQINTAFRGTAIKMDSGFLILNQRSQKQVADISSAEIKTK